MKFDFVCKLSHFIFIIFFRNVFSQVSPVCAIVGGVMAQEVIKALSQKEQPHNNMFFFNPLKNLGFVACIGC